METRQADDVRGVCNLCEAICGLLLTLEDGRGDRGPRQPRRPALPRPHLPQGRRRSPTSRRPRPAAPPGASVRADGWEEIGWDEAIGPGRRPAWPAPSSAHGRDAVGGLPRQPQRAQPRRDDPRHRRWSRRSRSRNTYSATSVDQLPHQLVAHLLFGHQLLLPVPDIDRTDYFLVLGANPMASNGSLMTVPDFPSRLRELKARGGRMVVLDPRRTETAKVADRAPLRPARAPTRSCCWRCCNGCSPRACEPRPGVRRRGRRGPRTRSRRSPRSGPSGCRGVPGGRHPADRRASSPRPAPAAVYGRIGRLDPGVRHRLRVGGAAASTLLTGNLDRARRGDVHRPRRRRRGAAA